MTIDEARKWINGEHTTEGYIPREPFDSWQLRIAQGDAAMIQAAYYVLKAHKEGLLDKALDGLLEENAKLRSDLEENYKASDDTDKLVGILTDENEIFRAQIKQLKKDLKLSAWCNLALIRASERGNG